MSAYRLATGGAIDRARPITFSVDGVGRGGFAGDTLASALLAQDVWLMGRSFKRHRPRGPMAVGVEEANALFTVGVGGRAEPNTQATRVALYNGLVARSQNAWPSLAFDLGGILDAAAPMFPAGFYYKTFKWPRWAWPFYEGVIRRMAGLGPAPILPDPDDYAQCYAHADLVVIGLGIAGLAAARAGIAAGLSVIVIEQAAAPGQDLGDIDIDGLAAPAALAAKVEALRAHGARVLLNTTAFGLYDHRLVGAVERLCAHGQPSDPAQRLWRIRAREIIVTTGAIERPLAFSDNDRPGVMLAAAAASYAIRFGVAVGATPVIATAGDSGYRSAVALSRAGVLVGEILDLRPTSEIPAAAQSAAAAIGARVKAGIAGLRPIGTRRIAGVKVTTADGREDRLPCDALLVSGGWTPAVHLYAHARGPLAPDPRWRAMVPASPETSIRSAGACAGTDGAAACWRDGWRAGQAAAAALGRPAPDDRPPDIREPGLSLTNAAAPILPIHAPKRTFVDFQNDVTAADISLAVREGYDAPEHAKRYTTLGMGADQGKTSGVIGLRTLAAARGDPDDLLAPTTYRPPFMPVTLGALAAGRTGAHLTPTRRSPLYAMIEAEGAEFQTSGAWLRPRVFPRPGESRRAATAREAKHVRTAVGVTDASTLGKIWIEGPHAAALLDAVYASPIAPCPVGRARYAFLLNDDGAVHDDGVLQRWGEHSYLLTTSTVRLADVLARLEYFRDVVLGGLDADVCDLTEAWSGLIIAGPLSAKAIATAFQDPPSPAAQGLAQGNFRGAQIRIARISYSGERAYEVYMPPDIVAAAWSVVIAAARAFGGGPYGLDALDWLRIEKGHIAAGAEIDGRASARDLGLARWTKKTPTYAGAIGAARPAFQEPGRLELVGIRTVSGAALDGAVLCDGDGAACGHVTSTGFGVGLGAPVALALLRDGRSRLGERLFVAAPTRGANAEVIVEAPCRFDPQGTRSHGD